MKLEAVPRTVEGSEFPIDAGSYSDISIGPETVVKRDRHPKTYEQAVAVAQDLRTYVAQLQEAGVPTADLKRVVCVPVGNDYGVEHEVGLVAGLSADQIPAEWTAMRFDVVARLVGIIDRMPSIQGHPDLLPVGIDSALRNWRISIDTATSNGTLMEAGEVVMVDFNPPLLRDEWGRLARNNSPQTVTYFERMCGTKTGAMAHVLLSAYSFPAELARPGGAAEFVMRFRNIIPADMMAGVADAVGEFQRVIVGQDMSGAALNIAGLPRLY